MPEGIALVCRDLMDRSRIIAAVEATGHSVVPPAEAGLILADLRHATPDDVRAWVSTARVVVFGPHVEEAALAEMASAGAEALPRSRFFQRLPELLGA
jgi:hypothetical protein